MSKWKAGQIVTLKYKNTKIRCRVMKSKDRIVCGHCGFDYLPILFCYEQCWCNKDSKMPKDHYFKILHKHFE